MGKTELLFIPGPGMGHLVAAVELGKLLVNRDAHLSVVFLIIQLPFDTGVDGYIESQLKDSSSRVRFVNIPYQANPSNEEPKSENRGAYAFQTINSFKPLVRDAVLEIISKSSSTRSAGIVVDMFCVAMIDVANEFELPSYVFFTSSAAFLGLMLHVQTLHDDHNEEITDYRDSDTELLVPSFINPLPAKLLPTAMLDKNGGSVVVLITARRIRETKGIIINTFWELESHTIRSLSEDGGKVPPIYPIGPIINRTYFTHDDGIMSWLDNQPSSSVVFLCFGSFGSFEVNQVKEIALALERSGCRFLWSLRRLPTKGSVDVSSAYANPEEVLPEGFLERTSGVGKVIGWAPQMAVLSHPSVGGFVSHCGWNSILESLWAGVPLAAWPMYAEQHINAFQMVVEMGIAVEMKMDYRDEVNMESKIVVSADEIENGIKRLMMDETTDEIREKVKNLKEQCRKAVLEDGSSYISLENLVKNIKGQHSGGIR